MSDKVSTAAKSLRQFLLQPSERNEDQALSYFRQLYPDTFRRQSDAKGADGYVPGHFVLEVKGDTDDWHSALWQALCYASKGLSFTLVVVACKHFLAIWRVEDLPADAVEEAMENTREAPNKAGKRLAQRYSTKKKDILQKALWLARDERFSPLLCTDKNFAAAISSFEAALADAKKVRAAITLQNFIDKLGEMTQFFNPAKPIKTVRAFYTMIYAPWDESSLVKLNKRLDDRATLEGVELTDLVPSRRLKFKEFVENHYIKLGPDENLDDFFARYDKAIDKVDPKFRIKHGIFFTDPLLSKYVMWLVKQHIPNLGKNYLVIDPACGSGNLVTNWRSPLELRHKVVSEIEPELLYAVEQRMKGDQWHNGKFTVIPTVAENKGLNFLDKSAAEYLDTLKKHLNKKGLEPDKPIAFLCNPPYRSDDDQTAGNAGYSVDPSIQAITGIDASSERYCSFLAQMKLICEQAKDNGFPEDSVLLLFTKTAWLTKRPVFLQLRRHLLGAFECGGGVVVNSKEFFDVKGKFPVAFSIWFYKGKDAVANPDRHLVLKDLTWLRKAELQSIKWKQAAAVDDECMRIFNDTRAHDVFYGFDHQRMGEWTGQKRLDFMGSRAAAEKGRLDVGGLPAGDHRRSNAKKYGTRDATTLGFMDDVTPCRSHKGRNGIPWFRLNPCFMDVRKARLLSGPPTHYGYCSDKVEDIEPTFVWYGLSRTFASCGYPLGVDNMEMWPCIVQGEHREALLQYCVAIAFAENDCVSTVFPAGNPVPQAVEVRVYNPMTPLLEDSYWNNHLLPLIASAEPQSLPAKVLRAVYDVYKAWQKELGKRTEVPVFFSRPYLINQNVLYFDAGIQQIRDYANEMNHAELLDVLKRMQTTLKEAKEELYAKLLAPGEFDYFGVPAKMIKPVGQKAFVPKTRFDHVLEKRLALSGLIIDKLHGDENFGRTKFAKVFYLADATNGLQLDTRYAREAAGPLDAQCFYDEQTGVEKLAARHGYFISNLAGGRVQYTPLDNLPEVTAKVTEVFKNSDKIEDLIELCRPLTTEQIEIVATLYACWNDLLIDGIAISDDVIVREFTQHWHPKKARFFKTRLVKTLEWMRSKGLVPTGKGRKTIDKPIH